MADKKKSVCYSLAIQGYGSKGSNNMKKSDFAQLLRQSMDEAGMKASELARKAPMSKQFLSQLLNDTPHTVTGKPPSASASTINDMAKAMNIPAGPLLKAAGFDDGSNPLESLPVKIRKLVDIATEMTPAQLDFILGMVSQVYRSKNLVEQNTTVVERVGEHPVLQLKTKEPGKSRKEGRK